MMITVDLPDNFLDENDPARFVIEQVAISGYKSEALTTYQASRLLGLSRIEIEGFLNDHHVMEHAYSVEMLEADVARLERLSAALKKS